MPVVNTNIGIRSGTIASHVEPENGGSTSPIALKNTHLDAFRSCHYLFNMTVQRVCQEVQSIIEARFFPNENAALLEAYLKSAYKLGASRADHALSRLFSSKGSDNTDRSEFMRARDGYFTQKGKFIPGARQALEGVPAETWNRFCRLTAKHLPKGLNSGQRKEISAALRAWGKDPKPETRSKALGLINQAYVHEGKGTDQIEQPLRQALRSIVKPLIRDCRAYRDARKVALTAEIKNFDGAIKFLDRRKQDGLAPWEHLVVPVSQNGRVIQARISSLPGDWQRAICRQAIEHMKSLFNLKDYVAREEKERKAALSIFESNPDAAFYHAIAPDLQRIFGENSPKRLEPSALIRIIDSHGHKLHSWRGADLPFEVPESLRMIAGTYNLLPEHGLVRGKARAAFWRGMAALLPEIGVLLEHHVCYQHLQKRQAKPPTATLPDPFQHPRHVAWSKKQLGAMLWPGESVARRRRGKGNLFMTNNSKNHLLAELPLLALNDDGRFCISKRWHYIAADRRLLALERKSAELFEREKGSARSEATRRGPGLRADAVYEFTEIDPVSGRRRDADIGEIKLILAANDRDRQGAPGLKEITPRVTIAVKRPKSLVPWLGAYRDGKDQEIDPRTNDPLLPDNLLVCSFVTDLFGPAEFHAAKVHAPQRGGRSIQFLEDASGMLSVNRGPGNSSNGASAASRVPDVTEILTAKRGAARLTEAKLAAEARMLIAKDEMLKAHPRTPERRPLAETFEKARAEFRETKRKAQKSWDHVTNMGIQRANAFAGEVCRRIEKLRERFPGHEVMVVLEHRFDRTPSKAKWGRMFNRHLAGVSGARVVNKLKEMLSAMDPPVAVVGKATAGLFAVSPGSDRVNVVQYSKDSSQRGISFGPGSQSAVIRTAENGAVKVRLMGTQALLARNLIQAAVTPKNWHRPEDKAEIAAQQQALLRKPEVRDAIMRLVLPNAR